MGLLDYMEGAKNKLAGLLGEMPISRMIHEGVQPPTVNGLRDALYAMPKPFNADDQAANEAAMAFWNPAGLLGKIVYHGSPHKFTKFDASKIGTGEGAQAYGHGVYLADAEDVAKGYQKTLAYKAFDLGQEAEKRGLKLSAGARGEFHRQAAANRDPMRAAVGLQNANISARELPQEKLAELFDAFQKDGTGALYKADLPDEWIPKMLDWDKPIKDQPEMVRRALADKTEFGFNQIGPDLVDVTAKLPGQGYSSIGIYPKDQAAKIAQDKMAAVDKIPLTGRYLYKIFEDSVGDAGAVSQNLSALGIPGIRYLDGSSRGAGQGSYNYVVFPGLEDQVKILERNGKGLLDY